MGIEQWWPVLEPSTRQWLVAHNGEPLPEDEIRRVGGESTADVVALDEGHGLSDEAVDWIEALANEERSDTE